ncbi:hypothetical protein HOY80DRAFT_1016712 [Tuber brumale]|nr:hypothetical protein HOY80DRAFT_1016712 [Tuber brumale]
MLPTPTASHLSFNHIYKLSDDTFLLLNTLTPPIPHSTLPLSANLLPPSSPQTRQRSIPTLSAEISSHTPNTTKQTVTASLTKESGYFLGAIRTDLAAGLRSGVVDMLVFNPPCPHRGSRRWGWRGRVDWSCVWWGSQGGCGASRNGVYNGVKWTVEKVGTSGRKGGGEVLGICRVMKW